MAGPMSNVHVLRVAAMAVAASLLDVALGGALVSRTRLRGRGYDNDELTDDNLKQLGEEVDWMVDLDEENGDSHAADKAEEAEEVDDGEEAEDDDDADYEEEEMEEEEDDDEAGDEEEEIPEAPVDPRVIELRRQLTVRSLPTIYKIESKMGAINSTLAQVDSMVAFLNNSVNDLVAQVVDGANQTMDSLEQINQAAVAAASFGADDVGDFISTFIAFMESQVQELQAKMLDAVRTQIYVRLDMAVNKFHNVRDDIFTRFTDAIDMVFGLAKAAADKLPSAPAGTDSENFIRRAEGASELAVSFLRQAENASELAHLLDAYGLGSLRRLGAASKATENDESLNATENESLNATENESLNATENESLNATENESLNASEYELLNASDDERANGSEHASAMAPMMERPAAPEEEEVEDEFAASLRELLTPIPGIAYLPTSLLQRVDNGADESPASANTHDKVMEKLGQLNETVSSVSDLLKGLNMTAMDLVVGKVLDLAQSNLEAMDTQCFGAVMDAGSAVPDMVVPMMQILCSSPLKLLDQMQPKIDEVLDLMSTKVDTAMNGLLPLMDAIQDLTALVLASQETI